MIVAARYTMAILFLSSMPALACGEDGGGAPAMYVALVAAFFIFMTAMLLPLAGILASLQYRGVALSAVWGVAIIVSAAAVGTLFFDPGATLIALALITLVVALFIPTGYYFYLALKQRGTAARA